MWFQLTYDKSLKHSHIGVQEEVVINIILEIVLSLFVIIKCEYAQSKKEKRKIQKSMKKKIKIIYNSTTQDDHY